MSAMLVAEFLESTSLLQAARQAKAERERIVDAFSPFPLEEMPELLEMTSARLRVVMFIGGMTVAAICYGIEIWSAVFNYPINSGGRPLNSWPAFVLFPFAVGIFGAALVGFIGLLLQTGLPRLHHPLFFIDGFERASTDRFMLALEAPQGEDATGRTISRLKGAGAVHVWELDT